MKEILGVSLYSCPYLNWQTVYVFLIIAYFYSSMELEKSTEQVLPGRNGKGMRGWERGKEA
jgi:hypothetical protein